MIVRPADFDTDALAIVEGAKDFASRVAFRSLLPADPTEDIAQVMALDGLEVLVAEHDGRIAGGIGLMFAPYLWNRSILTADELFWWTASDAPFRTAVALLEAAFERIGVRGAVPVFRKLATSPEGVERAYMRKGLELVETVYMGAV